MGQSIDFAHEDQFMSCLVLVKYYSDSKNAYLNTKLLYTHKAWTMLSLDIVHRLIMALQHH